MFFYKAQVRINNTKIKWIYLDERTLRKENYELINFKYRWFIFRGRGRAFDESALIQRSQIIHGGWGGVGNNETSDQKWLAKSHRKFISKRVAQFQLRLGTPNIFPALCTPKPEI